MKLQVHRSSETALEYDQGEAPLKNQKQSGCF